MVQQAQRKRKRAVLETVQEDDGNSKFARALGSVDNQTREKGLQALTLWLSKKEDLTEQDLKRLWKGIFYCFWHADKAPFQEDLAVRLAGILQSLSPKVAFLYFTVFMSTMRREWFGIDRLRLDKFMMLVRKFITSLFQYLQAQQWDMEVVQQFMAYIERDVLLSTDSHPAAGLMYHLADVYVMELRAVSLSSSPSAEVLAALLEPFCQVLTQSSRAAFLPRLREAVFDTLISEVLHPSEKAPLRHLAVADLADHLFQLGASPQTHAKNRHELYDISKSLEHAAKKQQQSAIGKQSKKCSLGKRKAHINVIKPAVDTGAVQSHIAQPQAEGSRKKHKAGKAAANGQTSGSVESPDAFAQEATAALHEAADDMPHAMLTQVNGKQLKKLKRKQRSAAASGPAEASVATRQRHAAQLAGAAEAVPLKLKEAKLAQQQQPTDLHDMDTALHQSSSDRSAKKKKSKSSSKAASLVQNINAAKAVSVANGHAAKVSPDSGSASQKKKKVRFAMKRNLMMQIGGAVPPEEIRTPPDSRPKGSALKRSSLVDHREQLQKSSGRFSGAKAAKKAMAGSSPSASQAKLFF